MSMYNPPHPGEVLKGLYLEPLNLTIGKAAEGLGVTRKTLSELVNAKAGISPAMAMRLAKAFGGTARSWLNLQAEYDLWQAKKNADLSAVKVFVRKAAKELAVR